MTISPSPARRGIAAVEFAILAPFMFLLLLGIWEVGRLVQVQQILSNAAREGARIAAQAQIITMTGAFTQIHTSTGNPNVTTAVSDYLYAAGITNQTGLNVQFQFLDGDTSRTDPYQGLKGERFQVTVTLPVSSFRWTVLSLTGRTSLSASVIWEMLIDDPFSVNTSLPGWTPANP